MNKNTGVLHVSCVSHNCVLSGVCVSLIDSSGTTVQQEHTNSKGQVHFEVVCPDEYRIRTQTTCGYSPRGQNRWMHLTPCDNHSCVFIFEKLCCTPKTGALNVVLRDANYPEYLLEKGVFTLWRGLK